MSNELEISHQLFTNEKDVNLIMYFDQIRSFHYATNHFNDWDFTIYSCLTGIFKIKPQTTSLEYRLMRRKLNNKEI